jgi:hypothetical protein
MAPRTLREAQPQTTADTPARRRRPLHDKPEPAAFCNRLMFPVSRPGSTRFGAIDAGTGFDRAAAARCVAIDTEAAAAVSTLA